MKWLIPTLAAILGCASGARAAAPAPLTTLHAVQALSNAEAERLLPVAFEATVIYYNRADGDLNVQEGDEAIFVRAPVEAKLTPGDRVLVRGITQPSFLPFIHADSITMLRRVGLPPPLPVSFDDLVHTKVICRLVRVRGVVRTANHSSDPTKPSARLELLLDGGYIDLEVQSQNADALNGLLDSEVEVTGAAGRKYDGKMQQTGAKVKVSSLADIKVLKPAGASPWSLPVTPLGSIITGYHVRDLTRRLRVHGTITYYQPGTAVVLQSGARSLWVSTQTIEPLQIGDVADATGFPETINNQLNLTHAEIQDHHVQEPIQPPLATWSQLASWGKNRPGRARIRPGLDRRACGH